MEDKDKRGNFVLLPLIVKFWGFWNEGSGIKSTGTPVWDRRADLSGIQLRCATAENPPYQILTPLEGENKGQPLEALRKWKGSTAQIRFPPCRTVGPDI